MSKHVLCLPLKCKYYSVWLFATDHKVGNISCCPRFRTKLCSVISRIIIPVYPGAVAVLTAKILQENLLKRESKIWTLKETVHELDCRLHCRPGHMDFNFTDLNYYNNEGVKKSGDLNDAIVKNTRVRKCVIWM